jgi:hypothetical protein
MTPLDHEVALALTHLDALSDHERQFVRSVHGGRGVTSKRQKAAWRVIVAKVRQRALYPESATFSEGETENAPDTGAGNPAQNNGGNAGPLQADSGPRKKSDLLHFEQVNEATWKVTDGTGTVVPTCHGYWAGYRTTRAIAWVICVKGGLWIARHKRRSSLPLPLSKAKAYALDLIDGIRDGVPVEDSVRHLLAMAAYVAPQVGEQGVANPERSEEAEGYRRVIAGIGNRRVIECADRIQWIIQVRDGDGWHNSSFHRERASLLRELGDTHDAILALPEHHDGDGAAQIDARALRRPFINLTGASLKPDKRLESPPLRGDDHQLDYYDDGYPRLPASLRRGGGQ